MMSSRILAIIPFIISSLVLLRTPGLLEFYRTSYFQTSLSATPPSFAASNSSLGTIQVVFNNTTNTAASLNDTTVVTSAGKLRKRRNRQKNAHNISNDNATRPPLSSLIYDARKNYVRGPENKRNETVIEGADVQFLLDFAIVGFPKCGTSSLSVLLGAHPGARINRMEMQYLSLQKPASAIWNLYMLLPKGDYKRGYKSPFDVTNKGGAMEYIQTLFPKTKLIVGVRHPILWFESFYNFRLQRGAPMPPPIRLLIGARHGFGVKEANFHVYLAKLGKTSMNAPLELEMKRNYTKHFDNASLVTPIPNDVFFYEVTQLADKNATRSTQFRRDLQTYLGLTQELPPISQANQGQVSKPKVKDRNYIDICDAKYNKIRQELLVISQRASTWFRTCFLDGNGVYFSSRPYLEEIFETWMYDPCIERRRKEPTANNIKDE